MKPSYNKIVKDFNDLSNENKLNELRIARLEHVLECLYRRCTEPDFNEYLDSAYIEAGEELKIK